MASVEEMKRTAESLWEVWSSGDILSAAPYVTSDFALCDHAMNRRHVGLDAAESFFAETRDLFRLEFELTNLFSDGERDMLAATWVLTATIHKSGVAVSVPGMSTNHFREGLVYEQNDHYSATDVLKTLFRYHPIRTLSMARKDLLS